MSGFLDSLYDDSSLFPAPGDDDPILDFDFGQLIDEPDDPVELEIPDGEDLEDLEEFSDNSQGLGSGDIPADEDIGIQDDSILSWKIDHASGDHKLKGRLLSLL